VLEPSTLGGTNLPTLKLLMCVYSNWQFFPPSAERLQAQFEKASLLTGEEFLGRLNYYANAWLPARDLLIASVTSSKATVDPSGKIILFEQFLPWKVGQLTSSLLFQCSYFF
jgi:hypothetical protein